MLATPLQHLEQCLQRLIHMHVLITTSYLGKHAASQSEIDTLLMQLPSCRMRYNHRHDLTATHGCTRVVNGFQPFFLVHKPCCSKCCSKSGMGWHTSRKSPVPKPLYDLLQTSCLINPSDYTLVEKERETANMSERRKRQRTRGREKVWLAREGWGKAQHKTVPSSKSSIQE